VRIYRFEGDFGSHNIWEVQAEIDAIVESGCRRIVLNVRRMSFINSSALGYLIRTWKELQSEGGEIVFSEPSEFVERTMSLLGLDTLFRVFPDDESAVAALRGETDG
jgi:anti-anti-sigma factor